METPGKSTAYVVASAVLSLAAHLLLLGFADRITFPAFAGFTERPAARRRLIVRTIDIRDSDFPTNQVATVDLVKETSDILQEQIKGNEKVRELFEREQLIALPRPELRLQGMGENLALPAARAVPSPKAPAAPRPKLIEVDADRLDPSRLSPQRTRVAKLPRQIVGAMHLPSLLNSGGAGPGSGGSLAVSMRLSAPSTPPDLSRLPAIEEPLVKPNGEADLLPRSRLPGLLPGLDAGAATGRRSATGIEGIDELLNVSLTVHQPPAGDGYFRIDISPNLRSDRLRAIPKDVLFLVDRSNSISPSKLRAFKSAVGTALEYLNSRDRFNVVAFWTEPRNLFQTYVPVTPDSVQAAAKYVADLARGGMTDVYAGLAPFVGSDKDHPERPLTVFVFTDGKSTVHDKMDNETLIRRVVEINRKHVSIYSLSCGKGTNRFLLDLLAYSNRGYPLHEGELDGFRDRVVGFIGAHSDIILADLDYEITGGLKKQIYPKALPQLYRGQTLSVYGRFPRGTEEIAMQLLGRSDDSQTKEFVFRRRIDEAAQANRDLSYDWVAQKVFALIVENTLSPSPRTAAELQGLIRKHNLQIPYF